MLALISVSDKRELEWFARELVNLKFRIISTGGTYKFLKSNGIPAVKIEELTGFPEILSGRVKTLHPKVHGGILAKSAEDLEGTDIEPIDMVVVNLYPFERFSNADEEAMIENIDIGGVALLRAAAKNYKRVITVSSPNQYREVISVLKEGKNGERWRRKLAMEAFALTASYDALIYNTLWQRYEEGLPEHLLIARGKIMDLRYGENPHQRGALYSNDEFFVQHHGKKLSFNNIYDMDSAYSMVLEFEKPASVVVKHANPCGAATGKTLSEAFERAWAGDPMSAYGSIVAFNREVDTETAKLMKKKFIEVVVAPAISEGALKELSKKKNLRIVEMKTYNKEPYEVRQLRNGFLMQDWDKSFPSELKVVSKRMPTEDEMRDMMFAWRVVKHVKSNAIVFAKEEMLIGTGAGQMSRVDSVELAARKAGNRAKGAVMASDAFFPFRDAIDSAHNAGITAVIQPGGSIRDEEVIDAVNEHDMAMVMTGIRVFRH